MILNEKAPVGFVDDVLHAVGLADEFVRWPSPVGDVYVAWNKRGISRVALVDAADSFEYDFRSVIGRPVRPAASSDVPGRVAGVLTRRLGGRGGATFADLRVLTPFERDVLECTATIPAGEARPYGWVAREIGRPGAVRAVGSALKRNPVPLLIPCHRVVRSDGRIGEYALGGPGNKRRLLTLEGVRVDERGFAAW